MPRDQWPETEGAPKHAPLIARSRTVHRPVGPVAYDCVKVIVVRDGSAILFSEFGQQPVKPGDVIGQVPGGGVTVDPSRLVG